ncbi:hypothetical protein RMCBS344292_00032 [Rhizopus microsporus]|nr:hypothetical protein RMCBS344292_00032 [Rhizopus microsporus]
MKSYQKDTESSQQRKKNVDRAKESHPQKVMNKTRNVQVHSLIALLETTNTEGSQINQANCMTFCKQGEAKNLHQATTQVEASLKLSLRKFPSVCRDSLKKENLDIFGLTKLIPPSSSAAPQPPKRKIEEIASSDMAVSSAGRSTKKIRSSKSLEGPSSLHIKFIHGSYILSKSPTFAFIGTTDDILGLCSVSAAFTSGVPASTASLSFVANSSGTSAVSASAVRSSVASSFLAYTTTISGSVVAKATDTSARKISRRLVHAFPSRSVHSETQTDGPPYSIDRAIAFIRHINDLSLHTTIDDIMTDGCFEDILVPRNTQLNERTVGELTQDPNPEWSRDPDLFYQISSQTEYNDLMHDYFNGHHPFKKDEVFKQPSSSRK